MLHRLLVTFQEIGGVRTASVLAADGAGVAVEGGGDEPQPARLGLLHEAAAMVDDIGLGSLDQIWVENPETTLVSKSLRADHSLWLTADAATPVGRLRHSMDLRAAVIDDLI